MNEDELRGLLHGAAGRGGTALLDDDAAVDAVVERHGARRRQRTVLVAAAACVALIAVVIPSVWPAARPAPDRDVAQAQADVLDWPVRGSLADDPSALDVVRGLSWSEPQWAPAPEARRVAFLGDVEGSRRALVVGRTDVSGAVTGQWFTGPVGAPPETLAAEGVVERLEDAASAGHVTAPGGVLVVLVAPGDEVEVSPRVEVGADGSVSREFSPVGVEDGVAVAAVDLPTREGSAGVYRVLRDGAVVESRPVPVSAGASSGWGPPVLAPLDPASEPPVAQALEMAVGDVLTQVGLQREEVRLDLLHSGSVPEPGLGEPVDAVVVAVTLPNGAVVVSTAWADIGPSGAGSAGTCGMQAHPAGTPLDQLAVGAECRFAAAGATDRVVLLHYATPAFDRVYVQAPAGGSGGERSRGFATVSPAPGSGTLRAEGAGVEPLELALIDAVPDQIVDRSGRGWQD